MKVNIFKKDFKVFNDKVVKCDLFARVIVSSPYGRVDEFKLEVSGKSKCNSDDYFDLKLGKELALARAKKKLYERAKKHVLNLFNEYKKISFTLAKDCSKLNGFAQFEYDKELDIYRLISANEYEKKKNLELENSNCNHCKCENRNNNKKVFVKHDNLEPLHDNVKVEKKNNKIRVTHINNGL